MAYLQPRKAERKKSATRMEQATTRGRSLAPRRVLLAFLGCLPTGFQKALRAEGGPPLRTFSEAVETKT